MNFWEFIDRREERRLNAPSRDMTRPLIGLIFIAGYYILVFTFSRKGVPSENAGLIRDAMLQLGPPIGLIVGALFRDSNRDEQSTANTGKMADAIKETAIAAGASVEAKPDPNAPPTEVTVVNPESNPVKAKVAKP